MASQVKKNKNQFLRKGIATSATSTVRNTHQDANIVDVSTIQSGVERIQIETPDISSGVHSGVERVPTDIPILNSSVQSGVERVPVDTLILNSGVWSGTERDQINIPNVNSGEINGSLRSTQKCAEGVNLDAVYKRPATNSCTEDGGRSVRSEEDSDAGGTMHVCTIYNQSSEYVPKLHSESCSKPNTDSISRSAVKKFAGQQTYDHVDDNLPPPLPKNPPPDLPAKPPRMAKYKTWHQQSSPANRGINQRSTDLKKHHSSKLQMEYSPQFSNNLNDDGEENEDVLWEYPGERKLIGQQMMASDIQYPNLKEHSQMHYGEEGILDNIEQGNQSSKAGHILGGQNGEQPRRTGAMEPGPNMQHAGTMGPGPTRHYAGAMGPGSNMHHAGTMGPGPTRQDAGAMGPGSNMHHAGTMVPEPNMHHAGAMVPGDNIHHTETMGPGPTRQYAGAMGPGSNRHHAGTMGQMPYQLNEGSIKQMHKSSVGQMHGGSVGQMYGGSVEQMHPYDQSEAMHSFEQEYMKEFQDVQYEHDDMGQPLTFPDTLQGYSQGNASYSPGASSFPGPSTNITDRELKSGQLDQGMNNPWFKRLVQNMKELVEREGLIVKDVFPDGNCLFTAVIDQLRVRGNFNFTPSTLRAAAVAFLRENPKQHDGTHLEQFLMNESWDQYLSRMCRDGEWGEHIILRAMSEVLKCRIIVLGGMSGNSSTVVQPQCMSDEEEKKMKKEKEANGSEIVKDESLSGTAKSEVTAAESHSLQTGAASSTSKPNAKTKGTDTSHKKVKTSSLSKQNKKDEELQLGEDLYIGLLGEMHYVSLRKKDWEERLNEKLRARIQKRRAKQRQEAGQIDDSSSDDDLCLPEDELGVILNDDFSVDRRSGVPVLHLNFLCREIIKFLMKPDLMPTHARAVSYQDADFPDWSYEIFGKEEFMLERLPIPTLSTHYTDLFNSNKESDAWKLDFEGFIYIMTKDTLLVESEENNLDIDLIIDRSNCSSSDLRLRPVNPSLWGQFVCVDLFGVSFLRHVCIDTARLEKTEWLGKQPSYLSFRCLWPREAAEYIRRYRRNSWPRKNILTRIISEGCRVVPRNDQNDDTLWTFSFYAAKKILISQGLSRHQKNCYKLWRLIITGCVKDIHYEHRELFRSIMFFACEIINSEIWENNPAVCVLYMTERLIIGLQGKFVPDYFIQQVNLVYPLTQHDTSCLTEKLLMIRYHFPALVYFVVDKYALSAGELLHTYDKVSKDLTMFREDEDFQRSFSDLILPVVRKEVKTSVEDRLYSKAEEKILRFYEGALRLNPCLNFSCYFQQFLQKLDIALQWCLAFYVDKRQGTSFLKDIAKNQKTIPITDLFGPELVGILGRLDVPEICTKGKNIVYFVDRVTDMFSELYLYEAEIVSLRFFLRKNYIADKAVYVFENDCLPENNGKESKKEPLRNTESRSIKMILYDMLYRLYHSLRNEEREIEFKDFMLQFENVCDRVNTVRAYKFLHELWEWFGDSDKAERAKVKYLSLKSKETDMYDVD